MQQLDLRTSNNQTFILTLDATDLATLYPSLSAYTWRMQIKNYETDATPLLEFVTSGTQGVATFTSGTPALVRFTASQIYVVSISGLKYFDIRIETASGEFVVAYGTVTFYSGVSLYVGSSADTGFGTGIGDTVLVANNSLVSPPGIAPISGSQAYSVLNLVSAAATAAAASATAAAASATAAAASESATVAAGTTAVSNVAAAAATGVASINSASSTATSNISSAETTAVAAVAAAASTYIAFNSTAFLAWLNGLPTTLPSSTGVWWVNGGVLQRS